MKKSNLLFVHLYLLIISGFCYGQQRAEEFSTLSKDGGYCWFSDPRAVSISGKKDYLYFTSISSTGDVKIGTYDNKNGEIQETVLYKNLQIDDHDNPSILVLPDNRLMVFFTKHSGKMYFTKSIYPEDITQFEPLDSLALGNNVCYTNPVILKNESNRIYVFLRGSQWKPIFITSEDLGKTWSPPKTLVTKANTTDSDRPYVKVFSDGESAIHFALTDGHPREEAYNSIYYLKYEKGAFYDAAGNVIAGITSLPILMENLPKAYDGTNNKIRAWIWDIAVDKSNHPILAFTTLPEETVHHYNLVNWDSNSWINKMIGSAGSSFPRPIRNKEQKEPEPHYSGGIVINPYNTSEVYVSKPIKDRFEILKYSSTDKGKSYTTSAITSASDHDNVRPYIIRGNHDKAKLIWLNINKYEHYTNYNTSIKTNILAPKPVSIMKAEAIKQTLAKVADWQIENQQNVKHHPLDWTNGALYTGMIEWAKIAPDKKYMDWLINIGKSHKWQPHKDMYHADDVVTLQPFLDIYRIQKADPMSYLILSPAKARLDYVIANPSKGSLLLDYTKSQTLERWTWCDALYMAPPVYAKMAAITGEDKYLKFMDKEFKISTDFLYDKEEKLYYRDHRYFADKIRETNGEKVFWGRGNGWVLAGLANLLRELPAKSKYRPYYEKLYKDMAAKIASIQGEDGFWHASLLDPTSYPNPETSASAFFCYGLAYGVNNGLISREEYTPKIQKSWQAIVQNISSDGKVGWIQPIGQDPKKVTADMTEVYGVGAVLLAGTEMIKLINKSK